MSFAIIRRDVEWEWEFRVESLVYLYNWKFLLAL